VQQFFATTVARARIAVCIVAIAASYAGSLASAQAPEQSPASARAAAASDSTFREVTDETGRTIRIPRSIHRIVSLAPSITETLYALGLQDELVGDTDYCDYPVDAQHKPKVGGTINPSLEAIAALRPDLVLVAKSANRLDTVRALADLNIPSFGIDPHTITDIISSTRRLADLLGVSESGAAINKDLQQRLAETQHRVSGFPQRRVLFVVWPQPLISVGRQTFIADALLYAGAVSIIDSPQDWPRISLEAVVHEQPEFLIFAEAHNTGAPTDFDSFTTLPGWRALDAVKSRRFALVSDAINRPSPRLVSVIEDLARQLHPEAFDNKPRAGRFNLQAPAFDFSSVSESRSAQPSSAEFAPECPCSL